MAKKNLNRVWSPSAKPVRFSGSFAPDTANPPTITYPTKRRRFSVVRTSQGLFTVTLLDPFFEWRITGCSLHLAAAAARYIQLGAKTATTFQIRVIDATGAVQDVAANADNFITFDIEAQDSGA